MVGEDRGEEGRGVERGGVSDAACENLKTAKLDVYIISVPLHVYLKSQSCPVAIQPPQPSRLTPISKKLYQQYIGIVL